MNDFPEYTWLNKIVLIVEDIDTNNMFFEAALRRTGAKLLWAKNGEEAVQICKETPNLDIILMDLQLPVMNGFEATRKIREFNPSVPIIAQTAHLFNGAMENSFEAGCNEFLSKPIRFATLLMKMEKYLK